MTTDAQKTQESEEAAQLQTYLTNKYPECRPEYPEGLYAWALAALTQDNSTLLKHVEAAKKKTQHRDKYVYTVLDSVATHLSK